MKDKDMEEILRRLSELKDSTMSKNKLSEMAKKPVLDTNDLAFLFNRKPETIHDWRRKNEICGKKINGRWYYSWKSIVALLDIRPDSN